MRRFFACVIVLLCILALPATDASAISASSGAGQRPPLTTFVDPALDPHPAVVVQDGRLALQQGATLQPWDFTGINAYQLTSRWGVNRGCGWGGWTPSTLDTFFASLPPNALVRTWFFQSDATTTGPGGTSVRDWGALDQVINAADLHRVHLVLTLGNQDGTCDDATWKGPSWYAGGYQAVPTQAGGPWVTSYAQWVGDVVSRYAANPAIAMWEPVNEPQPVTCRAAPGGNCYTSRWCADDGASTAALSSFFGALGDEIHRLDPGKLVSDGSVGGGNCGTETSTEFQRVISSPGLDVIGYHDYSAEVAPPGLISRAQQAAAMGKATMIGEAGVTGCPSGGDRAEIYRSKISYAFSHGISAYAAWWYDNDQGVAACSAPIFPDAPAWSAIMGSAGPSGPAMTSPQR